MKISFWPKTQPHGDTWTIGSNTKASFSAKVWGVFSVGRWVLLLGKTQEEEKWSPN